MVICTGESDKINRLVQYYVKVSAVICKNECSSIYQSVE